MPDVKYGVEFLSKTVVDVAKVVNVVSKFANGGGLFSLLEAREPAVELVKMDYQAVLSELKDMDASERAQVEAAFTGELKLVKPEVQVKVEEAVAMVEQVVNCASNAIQVVLQAKSVFEEFKKLVGV